MCRRYSPPVAGHLRKKATQRFDPARGQRPSPIALGRPLSASGGQQVPILSEEGRHSNSAADTT